MPELDEFGIPIKKKTTSVEVDEFGIPIKKDKTSTVSVAETAAIVPPVNKYKKAVEDDRSEVGKLLSGLYNQFITRAVQPTMEFIADIPAQFAITPTQFTPIDIGKTAESARKFRELPLEERLKPAKEVKKGIAKAVDVIRSEYTTREEEMETIGGFDVTDGLGLKDAKALVLMAGGMAGDIAAAIPTGGVTFATSAYSDFVNDYDENIASAGIKPNANARAFYGIAGGIVNGVLEKLAIDKIFGDTPAYKNIKKKVLADVLKNTQGMPASSALKVIDNVATNNVKKLMSIRKDALYRASVEGGTEAVQTALQEWAKTITNDIQKDEVFNEKEIKNRFFQNIFNSAAAGGALGPVFGLTKDVAFGRNINNELLNDVANAKTPEDFQRINDELETAFNENNFSQEERDLVMNNARRYAEIKQTLPQDASQEAQVKAIPLIESRISIDNDIQNRKNLINTIDESLREDEQKSISLLEDKRSQINDEIREAIAGEQFTYFEEGGKYFKKFGEAEPEEISRNRYDLEQIKKGQYATPESERQIQEGVAAGDIRERQRAQEGIPQEKTDETDIGYRYIVGEEGEEIPLAALVNKKVRIKGEPAILYRENQRLVARVLGTNRILDIFGTMPEMMNAIPEQFDVEVDEPIVTETPTGYRIQGEDMLNRSENPLDAISYDPSGKVMNVVLTNPAGRRRKFRGQAAQDLAYQITLKEALKNEAEFENFLQREYEQELQSAAVQVAAQEQAAPVVEPVPTERPAVPVEPTYGRATPTNVASVVGTKLQRKAVDDANRVVGSISPIVRAMTGNEPSINLHSQNTFTEAVLAAGGTREDSGTRGFYLAKDGTIHINMDNVAPDTVLHEGFHPILDYIEIANPAQINEFFSQLEGIEGAQPFIDAARRDYEGDTTQKKEAITSFVAGVANGDVIVNPSNFQKIRDFILNMLNKLGMDLGRPALLNVQNEGDLVKLAKYITEVFERGEAVTTERLGEFTETTPTPENPIAKSGQLQFQRTIYNQSGIEKAPALDRNEFKVAVDEGRISVVNPYESLKDKFFAITFPDDFFTGEVKFNGETIAYGNGGVFYSARFGKRGDVWAAAGENSANNFTIQGNESLRKNNGEGIIVLSKGEDLKQSTSLEANIAFINTIIKYADSIGELPGVVKGIKSAYTVGRAKSADSIIDSFNQYLAEGRGESGQRMVDAKQAFNVMSSALIKEAGPTITKMFRDMGFEGDTYFNKTQLKKGEYVATTQGLKAMFIDMLQEDFLKGVNNGAVYAALKFNSPIKFEKDLYHPSYPYVIKTVDGSPVRLEVFSKTFNSYGKEGVAVYGQERNKENAFGVATTTKPDFKLDPTFEDNPAQKDLSDKLNNYTTLQTPQFQRVAGAVNVAPLFSTKVTSIEEAKQIQSSDMYSKYRAVNEENAKLFNLAVDSQVDGIGGFDGVSEVTTVVNLTGEFNDIVNYSAIQGALAPEVQEATIAGMYVEPKSKEHNADKYIVGIDNQDAAIKAAQDAGFQNDGYTLLDDNISFFNVFKYPTKGFGVKLINFIKKYQDYGGKITYKKRQAVRSEYIDASRRKEILSGIEKSTVRQGEYRERLLDALKLAQERNDAFLRAKGIQFQKGISANAKKRFEDAKVTLKKNFNPYGILGKDVKILQEKMSGALKADLATAERNVSNLLALKEKYSGVVSISDMEAVMTGQAPANSLPADLSSAISEAREHIDTLTEQLIESGVIDNQETIDYYRSNKGKYLLRSYESITFKDDAVSSALYGKGLNIENVAKKLRNVDQSVVDSALKYLANRARLIDSIKWSINEDGTYDIEFRKYDKAQYSEQGLSKEQLAESIGADNANIIIDYNIDRKKVVKKGTLTRFSKDVNKDEQVVKMPITIYNKNISITQSEAQARKDANEILSDAESYVTRGLTGSTNVKSLSQRLDEDVLSPEIRALMGEYKDPIYNYYSSIFKISSLASSRNYLNQLRSQGLGKFLFEKGDANRPDNAATPIAAAGSETLAPLNGLYTYPEFAEALKQAEREKATTIESMAGRVRKFKTVYNPATHIKNLIGNMGFAVSNGHWNYAAETFKYIRQIIAGKQTPELLELLDVLNRQGVLNSSVGLNELRSYFDRHEDVNSLLEFIYDKGNKEASAYIKYRGVKANLNKIPRAIEKAYGMEDDVFKLLGFVNEANRYAQVKYSKNYFELNDSQKNAIREQTAEIVKDTYPTFSRVPTFVRRLSKTMFLGNFLSFPVESVRVSYNTLKLAMKEIKSGNPKLMNIGATRLAGTLIYNSLFSTASVYGFMAAKAGLTGMLGFVGGDDEEENDVYQAIINYLAPWTQKKDIYVHKFGDGKLIYSDIGSLDSYSYQKSVWNAFWQNINNDKGFTEAIGKSIYQGIEPFVQLDLFYDNILNVFKNEDRYGNNIYNPEENRLDKTKDIGAYMAKQLGPGVVSAMMKSYEYYDKGDFEKLQSELVSQFGARTYYTDLEKQFKNHIYAETSNGVDARIGFKNRLSNARSIYENAKRSGAKGAELDSKYDEALKAYKAILKEVESDYRAAIKGGVPERNLRVILNKSRLGETDIDVISILNGKYDFNDNAYIKK